MYDIKRRDRRWVVIQYGLVHSSHRKYRQALDAMRQAIRLDRIAEGLERVGSR